MQQEKELIQELSAPIRSIRLMAIESCLSRKPSNALLDQLKVCLESESDEECKTLLTHAITIMSEKMAGETQLPEFSEATFIDTFRSASGREKIAMLASLKGSSVKALASKAPQMLESESDNLVQAALIRAFGKLWPKDQLNMLSKRLLGTGLSVRLAALEALTFTAPKALAKALPKLLSTDDVRLRSLAIRGLAAIDSEAAVEHLEAMLCGSGSEAKSAALQITYFLPFASIKHLLLKFIASDPNTELVQKAGLVLLMNPDNEIPYRLWELVEMLPASRKPAAQDLLKAVCENIKDSNIFSEREFADYMNNLENWITNRRAMLFVKESVTLIEEGNLPADELESMIRRRLSDNVFRNMFEKALDWSINDTVKARITRFLKSQVAEESSGRSASTGPSENQHLERSSGESDGPSTHVTVDGFSELSGEEKVRLVGAWLIQDKASAEPILQHILESSQYSNDLVAAALRAAIRMQTGNFKLHAEKALKSQDPAVASAAIEYMGYYAPDEFFIKLGKFLQSPNGRIRRAALKTMQQYDLPQAISMLKAMLFKQAQRAEAFACLVNFDFPMIRDLIVEFMLTNRNQKELDLCLCMFQSNPSLENLYELFRLEKLLDRSISSKIAATRVMNEKFLVETGLLESDDLPARYELFAERFAGEQEKKNKPLPEYSLKRIRDEQKSYGEKIAAKIVEKFRVIATVSGTLMLLLIATAIYFRPERIRESSVDTENQNASGSLVFDFSTSIKTETQVATTAPRILKPPPDELFRATDQSQAEEWQKQMEDRANAAKAIKEWLKKRSKNSRIGRQ